MRRAEEDLHPFMFILCEDIFFCVYYNEIM